MQKRAIVIGAGFAGLSVATFLADQGWQVDVLEKHPIPGGRARQLSEEGFVFDMGPSWYWMPDVFERYFERFGKKVAQYYSLQRLDPSYRVFWKDGEWDVPAGLPAVTDFFEKTETGAGRKLALFLEEAAYKYKVGMQRLVYKSGRSWLDFAEWDVISGVFKLDLFTKMSKHVRKFFKHPKLLQLLEFPVLFLGALPEKIPALYSLMNYADIVGGTWYPQGGMYRIVDAMHQLALEKGVQFHFNEDVSEIRVINGRAEKVISSSGQQTKEYIAEVVIGAADYHFIESKLLPRAYRSYSEDYWNSRVMAPSCLLYYIGLNKRLRNLTHHSLFFDTPFEHHAHEIYDDIRWPSDPLFYVSATSVTDPDVAPAGCENLFFLIPVAAGLDNDTHELREKYFQMIVRRMEERIGQSITDSIVYKRSFAQADFRRDYNAFRGNAYGLANTLLQTAVLKPSCKSKKISNLFYTGQLTIPGPGVPPSLISGEVVANEVIRAFANF